MKKLIVLLLALAFLGAGGWLLLSRVSGAGGQAVLKINSTPVATVFLNSQNIGKTPYEGKHPAREYTLKLIPESSTESVTSWEGKVRLTANLLTFVNRELKDSELTSSGEMLTLEKISGSKAQLAVLSNPDGAVVTLSGAEKGTTPLVVQDIEPGSYDLAVSAVGFGSRTLKVRATGGYKLTAEFQLGLKSMTASPSPSTTPESSPKASPKPSSSATSSATPKPSGSPPAKPYVQILETPTGFLRVRKQPSTDADEISRVNPGEFYKLLDEQNGWYKIAVKSDTEGWISGQYAEKFE